LFTKINTVVIANLKNLVILKKGLNFCFKSINLTKRLIIKNEMDVDSSLINSHKTIKFITKSKIIDKKKKKFLKLKRYCFFKKTKNNTFLTITNGLGEVILRSSAGLVKVKTKKKKRNKETFMLICQDLATKCFQNKIKMLDKLIIVQSPFRNIFYKLRKIFNRLGLYLKIPNTQLKNKKITKYNQYLRIRIGFKFVSYYLRNSHNGIRLKKIRRV
jgi:ribosomal protein S11